MLLVLVQSDFIVDNERICVFGLCMQIFYLDRLNRRPMQWGLSPRIMAWDMEEIKKAKKADRFSGITGDYGYIGVSVIGKR